MHNNDEWTHIMKVQHEWNKNFPWLCIDRMWYHPDDAPKLDERKTRVQQNKEDIALAPYTVQACAARIPVEATTIAPVAAPTIATVAAPAIAHAAAPVIVKKESPLSLTSNNTSAKICPRCYCTGIPGDVLKCPSCDILFDPPELAAAITQTPVEQTHPTAPVIDPVRVVKEEVKEEIDTSLTQETHATQPVHANEQSGQTEDDLARAVNQEADFERIDEPNTEHEQSVSAGQFSNNELPSQPSVQIENVAPVTDLLHVLQTPVSVASLAHAEAEVESIKARYATQVPIAPNSQNTDNVSDAQTMSTGSMPLEPFTGKGNRLGDDFIEQSEQAQAVAQPSACASAPVKPLVTQTDAGESRNTIEQRNIETSNAHDVAHIFGMRQYSTS